MTKAWFRRRTFHVPNLTEYVRLWSDTGATSDSDGVPYVEPKLSSTKVRQTLSILTLLAHQTKTALQLTPDNLNFQGKEKIVQVTRSSSY